jgi:hypothetical protein
VKVKVGVCDEQSQQHDAQHAKILEPSKGHGSIGLGGPGLGVVQLIFFNQRFLFVQRWIICIGRKAMSDPRPTGYLVSEERNVYDSTDSKCGHLEVLGKASGRGGSSESAQR